MEASTKETVIIVHGTWAAPEAGAIRWYQPVYGVPSAGGFVSKLDHALGERGSPARCWAHCSEGSQIFHWSGENDWVARTTAASALREYVIALQNDGWRCHIVAHSHGGGVVAQALSNPIAGFDGRPGKIVTLGTPFMDTMSPILQSMDRKKKIADVASWIGIVILFLVFTFAMLLAISEYPGGIVKFLLDDYVDPLVTLVYLLVCAGLIWLIRRRYLQTIQSNSRSGEATPEVQAEFLSIGSLLDEPWQILHHMRNASNPLAIRSNPLSYVLSVLKASISNSSNIARIQGAKTYRDFGKSGKLVLLVAHSLTVLTVGGTVLIAFASRALKEEMAEGSPMALGAALELGGVMMFFLACFVILFAVIVFFTNRLGRDFYSAYSLPLRWLAHLVWSLGSIFTALATYMLRRKAWSLLQAMAMGLEGYRYTLPNVEQSPSYASAGSVKYESMPTAAEQRALKARSNWVGLHLGDVSQAFATITVTAADITTLLRMVEADQSLVHGAYYSDDDCIARIADWIAGRG